MVVDLDIEVCLLGIRVKDKLHQLPCNKSKMLHGMASKAA